MRVLGIDPGINVTGLGVVEMVHGRLAPVHYGEIRTRGNQALPERLIKIYQAILGVITDFQPEVVVIEDIFFGKNPASLIKQGQVRGVSILAGALQGRDICEYSPLEVKLAVVGYGRAEKRQVQHMVKEILSLPEIPPEDAADALAVAICHAHHVGSGRR